MEWFWDHYLASPGDGRNPYFAAPCARPRWIAARDGGVVGVGKNQVVVAARDDCHAGIGGNPVFKATGDGSAESDIGVKNSAANAGIRRESAVLRAASDA